MKKILILIFLMTGCSEKIFKVENHKILVPKSLLIPKKAPKAPKKYNEEEISKYILELYKRFKINENNIHQIDKIITKYNDNNLTLSKKHK